MFFFYISQNAILGYIIVDHVIVLVIRVVMRCGIVTIRLLYDKSLSKEMY